MTVHFDELEALQLNFPMKKFSELNLTSCLFKKKSVTKKGRLLPNP